MLELESCRESVNGHLAERLLSSYEHEYGSEVAQYSQYEQDPVGFGSEVLGDTYTQDVQKLMESVRDYQYTVAKSGNATGKALMNGTPVLTPDGWVAIEELTVGDCVYGKSGERTEVVGVYPQGKVKTYQVTFNDGSSVVASSDHIWTARSSKQKGRGKPWQNYTTEDIKTIITRHMHIPMCEPVRFRASDLREVSPYVMGMLIADGGLTQRVVFDTADTDIYERIKRECKDDVVSYPRNPRCGRYGITTPNGVPNRTYNELKATGLLGHKSENKWIPKKYLIGSIGQRKDLLAGLMDGDGYIDSRHSMSYSTSSPELAENVQTLVWSLGGTAIIKNKKPVYTHNGEKKRGRDSYTVNIKIPFNPFYTKRKRARYVCETKLQKQAHRCFKKIEDHGEQEATCIRVEADDGLFITDKFIVTHNSHCAARIALWWLKIYPTGQVYTAAAPPESNLRNILWGEIGSVLTKHPDLTKGLSVTNLNIRRNSLSFLTGVTIPVSGSSAVRQAKFSGKHAPHLLFILDEADGIPDEVYLGIESCMSGGHCRLLCMFNPRGEQGEVYRMVRDNRANVVNLSAFSHDNVVTGQDLIPGAVTREVTVRRINEWCRPLAPGEEKDNETFELPEFLSGVTAEKRSGGHYPPLTATHYKIVEPAFAYMVLGEYPPVGSNKMISRDWINKARTRYDTYVDEHGEQPPKYTYADVGLDVAEFGDDANCMCFRYGGFVPPMVTWRGMDPLQTARRAEETLIGKDYSIVKVDANGVGSGVSPILRDNGVSSTPIKVTESPTEDAGEIGDFKILRDQILWAVREWLRTDDTAMLPPDEVLIEELLALTYHIDNGKIRATKSDILKELLKRSPDRLMGLAFTFAPSGLFGDSDLE